MNELGHSVVFPLGSDQLYSGVEQLSMYTQKPLGRGNNIGDKT